MSRALWWVRKGLAVAPPGTGCIIGVSTSMKPRLLKNSRIRRMISTRLRKVSRTSGLTIRSR